MPKQTAIYTYCIGNNIFNNQKKTKIKKIYNYTTRKLLQKSIKSYFTIIPKNNKYIHDTSIIMYMKLLTI
jgi:hypothetical protein